MYIKDEKHLKQLMMKLKINEEDRIPAPRCGLSKEEAQNYSLDDLCLLDSS